MTLSTLEPILIQFCFAIFLLVTLVSWGNLIIYSTHGIRFFSKKAMILGYVCLTGLLVIRWLVSDHLPLSNLYESSLFLAWSLTLVYLLLERYAVKSDWLDAIIAPSVMITYTFTTLGLPKEMQQSTVLVPALQSNWLMMHVSMMIFSYGALLFGSLLAVTLLTCCSAPCCAPSTLQDVAVLRTPSTLQDASGASQPRSVQDAWSTTKVGRNEDLLLTDLQTGSKSSNHINTSLQASSLEVVLRNSELLYFDMYRELLVNQIDYWSYRIIGIGFPLLTIGILSGAVWANEAWGSYWSWDPKETWALITWLIFAIYLHLRMTRFAEGASAALVASLGFCVVWMCYLGVNLLGKGLHSYGWLS
jgi:cytochrome c-type biogenesis protein CcsB